MCNLITNVYQLLSQKSLLIKPPDQYSTYDLPHYKQTDICLGTIIFGVQLFSPAPSFLSPLHLRALNFVRNIFFIIETEM